MRKVLLTGATGFIGKAVLSILTRMGIEVVAVVRSRAQLDEDALIHVIKCPMESIETLPDIIADRDIDCVIHLAWEGSAGAARADYDLQLSNVSRTLALIEAMASMRIPRFIGAGTLAEDDILSYGFNNCSKPNLVSCYGTAKAAAHLMTKALCAAKGIEHIWCKLVGIYGEGNTTGNFVSMAIEKMCLGDRCAFTDGEQNIDFMYIDDAARALCTVSDKGHSGICYVIGSSHPRQLKEYIYEIRDIIDPAIELYLGEIPFNGRSLPLEAYDTSRLTRDTGFMHTVEFSEGIRRTVAWFKSI